MERQSSDFIHRDLSLHYVNAGGMRSKVADSYEAVSSNDFDVIIIVESWLVTSVLSSELALSGWSVFRRDRYGDANVSHLGGGILILVQFAII